MGLFDFIKGMFASPEFQVDYSTFDDEQLLEILDDLDSLTEAARAALGAEMEKRGLEPEPEEEEEEEEEPTRAQAVNVGAASSILGVGSDALDFNAPAVEEDDGERRRDPLEVARLVVEERGAKAPGKGVDPLFVEAVWLLTKRGEELPTIDKAPRRGLAAVVVAAATDDLTGAFDALARFSADRWKPWLGYHLDSLLGRHWPAEAVAWCDQNGEDPGLCSIEALAAADADAAVAAIVDVEDPGWRTALLGEAIVAAQEAGQESDALTEAWDAAGEEVFENRNAGWLAHEIRRLCRVDLAEAERLLHDTAEEGLLAPVALEAVFARLVADEPERALELCAETQYGVEALPRLRGCHAGGADIGAHLERFFVEGLAPDAHQPHVVFRQLVDLCLARDDAAGVARALEAGGPHAWQTVLAATDGLREAARRGSASLEALLEACLAPTTALGVAGRDASAGGQVVGHVEYRPRWLELKTPRPIEALVIAAALDDDAPWWRPLRRPLA